MKALVVDDSMVMRKVLARALSKAGIEDVDQARDGREAVAAVQKADYGLVLMDWNMPVKAGIDALKDIRALGKEMPIIMITTEAERPRVIEALKLGATSYFRKPFDPDDMASRIQEVIANVSQS